MGVVGTAKKGAAGNALRPGEKGSCPEAEGLGAFGGAGVPVRWAIAGRVELEVVAFQLTAVGGKAPNRSGEATDVVGLGETEAEAFGVVGKGGELEAGTHPGDGRGDDGEGDVQRR